MFVIRLRLKTPGRLVLVDYRGRGSLLIWIYCSAKDAVAALIKRLAHRNANVQLYTLEVRTGDGGSLVVADFASSPMLWRRTAAPRYIVNWRRGALRMRFYDSRMTV